MDEQSRKFYSKKDLGKLLEKGVHILDLNLVHITRDVQLENIFPGSPIYSSFAQKKFYDDTTKISTCGIFFFGGGSVVAILRISMDFCLLQNLYSDTVPGYD